ncbi:hypothetical protein [Frankia sp. AgKG'84/4]|uniref:hypothetical protein n=1 Tax=Frankia sp. AgKG'84/4 TaxID=573490 RepID=UPI00200E7F50|nr:hypothetical protein [Frankia sp. AgKG'84/4]MCL9795493.1 hypothetical protein [Frankia sp. AgKG'84/4]
MNDGKRPHDGQAAEVRLRLVRRALEGADTYLAEAPAIDIEAGLADLWARRIAEELQKSGIAMRLVLSAVRALHDPADRARYIEEWSADLVDMRPGWRRLRCALGIRIMVPTVLNAARLRARSAQKRE